MVGAQVAQKELALDRQPVAESVEVAAAGIVAVLEGRWAALHCAHC